MRESVRDDVRDMVVAEGIGDLASAAGALNESGRAQHPQVLGDERLRCLQRLNELVHAAFPVAELREDAQAQRRGQDLEQLGGGPEVAGIGPRHPQKLTGAYLCMHWRHMPAQMQRVDPPQIGEAGEVGVCRDQRDAMIDGQGGELGIGHRRTPHPVAHQQLAEQLTVVLCRLRHPSARGVPLLDLLPGVVRRQWDREGSRVGRDPEECS